LSKIIERNNYFLSFPHPKGINYGENPNFINIKLKYKLMNLSEKNCVACAGGIPPLSNANVLEHLKQTPDWKVVQGQNPNAPFAIEREFKFKNFAKALEFTNKIGAISEAENHHPDIKLGWGYVSILIQTHKIAGLHENDFILAAKIDKV
jgi:4a-hydroxytetrahydrobiopterin dehydratase